MIPETPDEIPGQDLSWQRAALRPRMVMNVHGSHGQPPSDRLKLLAGTVIECFAIQPDFDSVERALTRSRTPCLGVIHMPYGLKSFGYGKHGFIILAEMNNAQWN